MSRRSKEHATEEKGRVSQFKLSLRNRSRSSSRWPTTISRGEKSALRTANPRVPPSRVSTTASTHVAGTCRYKSVRLACMSHYIEQEGPFNNTRRRTARIRPASGVRIRVYDRGYFCDALCYNARSPSDTSLLRRF